MHVDQHELDQLNVALALSAAEAVAETQAATLLESAPQPQPTGTSDPDVAPLASSATDVQPPQGSPATGAPPVVGNAGASVADAQLGTQLVVASTGAAVAAAPAPAQVVPVEEDVNITVKCAICNLEALCAKSKVLSRGAAGSGDTVRWQCGPCQRVDLAVARKIGSIQFLRDMRAEQAETFYRAAHQLKPDQIKKLCLRSVEVADTQGQRFEEGGAYLPLKKWAQDSGISQTSIPPCTSVYRRAPLHLFSKISIRFSQHALPPLAPKG